MDGSRLNKRKRVLRLAVLVLFILAVIIGNLMYKKASRLDGLQVRFKDYSVHVEVADSASERERGLCCRSFLDENRGMLFIYDTSGDYRFWMKDTRIPLDMYWISSNKKIVHIEKNVQPSSYPKTFGTNTPSQYILETNAGFADKHNIQVGDQVNF